MFRKYAKNFLEKEIVDPSSSFDTSMTQRPSPFSSPIATAPLSETYFKEEPQDNFERDDFDLEEPETIIGEEVSVKGTLSFQRLLRIDGTFEGELISEGKLIIGPNAHVKAHINLKEAYISGKVDGDITVKERLVLRGRAEVRGNITAPLLSVDEGVAILGQLTVVSQTPSISESP